IAVVSMALGLEQLLRLSLGEVAVAYDAVGSPPFASITRRHLRLGAAVVAACVAFAAAYLATYAIFAHRQFGPNAASLAQYDSVFFATLHGHPFRAGPLELGDGQYLG